MALELIGWVAHRIESELLDDDGPPFDKQAIEKAAKVHEEAGFDTALVGYYSDAPDGFLVAAHAVSVTTSLRFLIAHRPGFVSPTVAARKFATLDQLSDGRAAVHLIAGSSAAEQARDGDFLDHDRRYTRMAEYIDLMKLTWTQTQAFDFDATYYKVKGGESKIRCLQKPHIPVFGGGGSNAAINVLAPRVDVFMLWGEPLAETAAMIANIRAQEGSERVAPVGFSVSTRPILGATDADAWERAHGILEDVRKRAQLAADNTPENVGSRRLLAAAAAGELHDTCLWTPLAGATGAYGNTTALVGSAERVAQALFEYYKLGATRLLIRGWDPLFDAQDYGRELIPRLRQLIEDHDRRAGER